MKTKIIFFVCYYYLDFILNQNISFAQNLSCKNHVLNENEDNQRLCWNGQEQEFNNEKSENYSSIPTIPIVAKYFFGIPPIPIDPLIPGVRADDDFETWVPPAGYRNDNILSGFDFENRPVWIGGSRDRSGNRADVKSVERMIGLNNLTSLHEKYVRRTLYLAIKSTQIRSKKEKPVSKFVYIVDLSNFSADGLASPIIVYYAGTIVRKLRSVFAKYAARVILINVNFVSEIWLNLIRIVNRRSSNRLEIYGTDKVHWIKQLQKRIPRD